MYVLELFIDGWEGEPDQTHDLQHPTLEQIEAAISLLDGKRRTLVILWTNNQAHMGISGGEGSYVVYAADNNGTIFQAVSPASAPTRGGNVTGRQQTVEYRARGCVDQPSALCAARAFALDGTLEASLTWERR